MRGLWRRIQCSPAWIRWPVKWAVLAGVTFLVLYPDPRLFIRTIRHERMIDELSDPSCPSLVPVLEEFEGFLAESGAAEISREQLLTEVERFVLRRVPYAFDWEVWGVVDYLPTLPELLAKGREDCDGRAVLAAAILRARGIDAHLVGDPRHLWVTTPHGQLMGPLGQPVFAATASGLEVDWLRMLDPGPLAFGIAIFPVYRELIILLCAWLLLLWPSCTRLQAGLLLLLLVEALILLRLAGRDPRAPMYGGILWAGLHILGAVWVSCRLASTGKRSDRSVCFWSV